MKKDEVLEQYKFFVDSPNLGTDTDGTVRIVRRIRRYYMLFKALNLITDKKIQNF